MNFSPFSTISDTTARHSYARNFDDGTCRDDPRTNFHARPEAARICEPRRRRCQGTSAKCRLRDNARTTALGSLHGVPVTDQGQHRRSRIALPGGLAAPQGLRAATRCAAGRSPTSGRRDHPRQYEYPRIPDGLRERQSANRKNQQPMGSLANARAAPAAAKQLRSPRDAHSAESEATAAAPSAFQHIFRASVD